MKLLTIEVEFPDTLSQRGEVEVKNEIQDLRESFGFLDGVITKAELKSGASRTPPQEPK